MKSRETDSVKELLHLVMFKNKVRSPALLADAEERERRSQGRTPKFLVP